MSPSLASPAEIGEDADSRLEPMHVVKAVETPARLQVLAFAAWHSVAWLTFANAVGVLLAMMLLFPGMNRVFDSWSYGRWIIVHVNLQLYGWCSLPLVAFLFKVYGIDREPAAKWARPVLWVWSSALVVASVSWITGHSSGKLFLDWTGYSRVLFPVALLALWVLLAYSLRKMWGDATNASAVARGTKIVGLFLLLAIPFLIYVAASPNLYPPINPDTGGPTGASQLESTLVIIAILLLLPLGLTTSKAERSRARNVCWWIFAAECVLCLGLGRADVSHHRPTQYLSLASLLVWIPLVPAYYASFRWHANTRRWRVAFLVWWAVLVPTGWMLFLPGVLDHFKFTDGLVGHSLLAFAGFSTSLLIFILVELLGDDGWIFNFAWSFYMWQISALVYVALMFTAGWREGWDPGFTMLPGTERNVVYGLRLLVGTLMFVASIDWMVWATVLLREQRLGATYLEREGARA